MASEVSSEIGSASSHLWPIDGFAHAIPPELEHLANAETALSVAVDSSALL